MPTQTIFVVGCFPFISIALRLSLPQLQNSPEPLDRHNPRDDYIDPVTTFANFKRMYVNGTKSKASFALFEVACGEHYCREMITSLKSLAVQYTADGKWDAWCVVDKACSKLLDQELPLADMTCNKLPVEELLSTGTVTDLFKRCASARLWVPHILTDYKYLLYLDSDTMITNSIQPVLQAMEEQDEAVFSMVENVDSATCAGCGWYNSKPSRIAVKAGLNGYNSGVLGINVHLWHQRGMNDKIIGVLKEVKDGKVQLELGDQDILNLLARRDNSFLQQFPCEVNMRSDSRCIDKSGYHMPVILHGTRDIFHGRWKNFYRKLMKQTNAMLSEWSKEQRLAMSLWKASKINVSALFS